MVLAVVALLVGTVKYNLPKNIPNQNELADVYSFRYVFSHEFPTLLPAGRLRICFASKLAACRFVRRCRRHREI
jgi:hypothetical protein